MSITESMSFVMLSIIAGLATSSKFGETVCCRPSTDSRYLLQDIIGYGKPLLHVPLQIR